MALDAASRFGFVRTIGEYGVAVLNLLGSCEWEGNPKFLKKVTEAARQQAVYYPDFMKIASETLEPLTAAELQTYMRRQDQLRNRRDTRYQGIDSQKSCKPYTAEAVRKAQK